MESDAAPLSQRLAEAVRQCLTEELPVKLEGLGILLPNGRKGVEFVAETKLKVFIAYVDEESEKALKLYEAFTAANLDPWLDKQKLLPGQNWPRCIEQAIGVCDFFVPCFSRLAVRKRSQFHYEVRHALECAKRMPLDDIFIMPLRLDACPLPKRITSQIQYVDMFPDWNEGLRRILSSITVEARLRAKRRSDFLF